MRRIPLPLCGFLVLAACVTPGATVQTADGMQLQVRQDDNYFWPDSFTDTASDGTQQEIDVFPVVTALVVSRADGMALTKADEPAARTAVDAHCKALSMGAPGTTSRFAGGAWAYSSCAER